MAGFALKKDKNGAVAFVGLFDERADFSPVMELGGNPLALNFRGVVGINSLGVGKYLDFVELWDERKVFYDECPQQLVDAFLMLPALLGPEDNTAEIRSLAVPYRCAKCQDSFSIMVRADEIKGPAQIMTFPARVCPKCSAFLKVEPIAEDFAVLVEQGALKIRK